MTDIVGTYSRESLEDLMKEAERASKETADVKESAKKAEIEENRSIAPYRWVFWPFKKRLATDEELLIYNDPSGIFVYQSYSRRIKAVSDRYNSYKSHLNGIYALSTDVKVYDNVRILFDNPECQSITISSSDMNRIKRLASMKITLGKKD